MIPGQQIVDAARGALGTPWHHTGRVVGKQGGIDCVGLLYYVSTQLGLDVEDLQAYTGQDDLKLMTETVEKYCNSIQPESLGVGDILIFSANRMPNHCGIYCGQKLNTFIHAWASTGVTVEMLYSEWWQKHTVKTYRLKASGG